MMKGLLSEKKLLYKIQTQKDPEAFGKLYDLYIEKIYRFIYLKLSSKEEAEDVASEVFLKAWHYLIDPSKESVKHFSGLVYKIARNSVIDVYRKRSKTKELPIEVAADTLVTDDILSQVEQKQEFELILKSLHKLKNQYQELIVFRYIDELSISEIADILGKKQTAVRVSLHRAIKILKNTIEIEHEQATPRKIEKVT